jgi:hypothetical protein
MGMRIRYNFKDDTGMETNLGISRQTYTTASGEYVRVVVDKENFKFEIVNNDGKAIVSGGDTKNYIVLLRQAKRALEGLGAAFATEERNRDYGIVKKGE